MRRDPAVRKKTQICECAGLRWYAARVAAAGQLLSCGSPLKYTSRIPPQSTVPSEINGPERWGASNHINVMHFSNFHPGNHPTLEEEKKKSKRVTRNVCNFVFHTIAKLDSQFQTRIIKTFNLDCALSNRPYPAHTTRSLCQTTRGPWGWGGRRRGPLLQ